MTENLTPGQKAYHLAYEYEQKKGHCAQCTLIAIMETCDVMDKNLFKAVDGLTGGTAMSARGTCGALAAGILMISQVTGRSYEAFQSDTSDHVWEYVHELTERFFDKYGSPLGCKVQEHLFGRSFNLRNADERKQFEREGAHINKCPSVCGDVAMWTVEIIFENEDLRNKIKLMKGTM